MKKIIALFLTLTLVLTMAVCGALADDKPYIGITIFDYSNSFVGYIRNGIDYYIANECENVDYMMVDGENNQATQTERIDTMINKGVNVLAVNPVDSSAAETIIAKAKEANLPVIFFNRMPTLEVMNSYDRCWYVGLDSIDLAKVEAAMVVDAWKNDQAKWDTNGDGVLQYVLIKGVAGHSDTVDRENGIHEALAASGIACEELANEFADWSAAKSKELMETWIGKYGDKIEMVISSNDAMALGAVEALKGNGLITDEKFVPVVGINALPETAELIKNGVMLGSVLTSTYDTARAVIDLCLNAYEGKEDVTEGTEWKLLEGKIIQIEGTKITSENTDLAVEAYKTAP